MTHMAATKTEKAYVVEFEGDRYIGFPREDSWKLYECGVAADKDGFVTYKEPKVLGTTYFVRL